MHPISLSEFTFPPELAGKNSGNQNINPVGVVSQTTSAASKPQKRTDLRSERGIRKTLKHTGLFLCEM